jgi:hypothetical protein
VTRRKIPQDYHILAEKRAFEWLGPEVRNTDTKTTWKCTRSHEWQTDYGHIKQGRGCPYCSNRVPKTHEDYHGLARIKGFKWLGEKALGVMSKTQWRCSQGHEWEAKYNHIKNGRGCPYCAGRAQKTPEDFRQLAKIKGFTWLGPEVPNTTTKTRWRCDEEHEFLTTYTVLRASKGKGCPYCAGKAHKKPDDYYKLADRRDYEWLGPVMPPTVFGKTLWCCNQGHEWKANYHHLDYGHGCPHCAGLHPKGPTDYHALAELKSFQWLGPEVNNTKTKTFWRCPKGHSWGAAYNNITKTGCPHCFLLEKQSKGEKRVSRFLEALDIMFVEYNGEQHYKPIERWGGVKGLEDVQRRDRIKADFAQANGLHLIIIPYTDFERIGTIIIDKVTEATGVSPLEYQGRPGGMRGAVEVLGGVQLSLL